MFVNLPGRTARELARSIEEAVHGGGLQPGEPLPPIRQLAAASRISPVTVAAAYRRLRTRGIVVGEGRQGDARALQSGQPRPPADQRPAPEGLIDLATGNPDPDLLPALRPRARAPRDVPRLYGSRLRVPRLIEFAAGEFAADGVAPTTDSGFWRARRRLSVCFASNCARVIVLPSRIRRCPHCSI